MKKKRQSGKWVQGVMRAMLCFLFVVVAVAYADISQAAESADSGVEKRAPNYTMVAPKKAGKFPMERKLIEINPQFRPLAERLVAVSKPGDNTPKRAPYYTMITPKRAGKFTMERKVIGVNPPFHVLATAEVATAN